MKKLIMFAMALCFCSCGDNSAQLKKQQEEIELLKQRLALQEEERHHEEAVKAAKVQQEKEAREAQQFQEKAAQKTKQEVIEKPPKELAEQQAKEQAEKQAKELAEQQAKGFLANSVPCTVCRGAQHVRLRKLTPCEQCKGNGVLDGSSTAVVTDVTYYHSTTKAIQLATKKACNLCDGTGFKRSDEDGPCPFCKNGRILKADLETVIRCTKCRGLGEIDGKKFVLCGTCGGRGQKEGMLKSAPHSYYYYHGTAPTYREMLPCTFCNGQGVLSRPCRICCDQCQGLGVVKK